MTDYTAQRRYPRIESENSLLVRCVGACRQEGFVKTQVVGLGGCSFINDEPLGVGTPLEVAFSVRGQVGRSSGRIVYEIPKRFGRIEVGVEFVGISLADRKILGSLFHRGGQC
ncbi:MAG TPA: PilZ domain-containing protein [Deferrisomatales bacterium]|nr:PilZ domain-containing protein [Deferrisomatales bacterium]